MYFLIRVYASMHPMQLYINLHIFSYINLFYACILCSRIYKLECISYISLCYACILCNRIYKLVCIFLYKSMLCMHPMQPYINFYVCSYISLCIYASMHPMQPYINLYVCSYISLCIYESMHPMQLYINLYINSYKML